MSYDSDKKCRSGGQMPLRRLQLAFNRIIETSIPFNLNAIERHNQLIEEYRRNEDWDRVMREQMNGLQSVHRLKADLRELESLAQQVTPNDYPIVGQQIAFIKTKVCSTVELFLESNEDLNNPLLGLDSNVGHNSNAEEVETNEFQMSPQIQEICIEKEDSLGLIAQISQTNDTFISWLNLRKELNDLNEIFNTLMTTLMRQKETVNTIETNVENASENVLIGTQHLSKASALKSTFVPITAGLLGGAVFGPIGMMAGFKFSGIAAAVGASIVSYSGVKFIQKKSITKEEMELISTEKTNTIEKKKD